MTDDRPHISLFDTTPDASAFVDEFHDDIRSDGLTVGRERREEPPVYSAVETIDLPTLIMVGFGAYFTAFLVQTGKDHSIILTSALKRLARKLFQKEKDTAIVQSGKIERPALYSVLFSIWARADKCTIKFVFKTKCSEIEYVSTVSAILKFLEMYYSGESLDEYAPIVEAINTHKQIVVAYDHGSNSLYLV